MIIYFEDNHYKKLNRDFEINQIKKQLMDKKLIPANDEYKEEKEKIRNNHINKLRNAKPITDLRDVPQ